MNMLTPVTGLPAISPHELEHRVRAACAAMGEGIGLEGYFSIAGHFTRNGTKYEATHWFKPDQYAWHDCKAVASGTLSDCLAAVERYAAERAATSSIAAE